MQQNYGVLRTTGVSPPPPPSRDDAPPPHWWVSSERITAPAKVGQRLADEQTKTDLLTHAWVRHSQCYCIMIIHKERVMSFQCTHICLQQYVCLRPHATTNYSNRCSSSNTFISLILLCTVLSEIGHPACGVRLLGHLLASTTPSNNLLALS